MDFFEKFSPNGKKEEFQRHQPEEENEQQENLVLSGIIEEKDKIYFKISPQISMKKLGEIFSEIMGNLNIEIIIKNNFGIEVDADEKVIRVVIYTKDFSDIKELKKWSKNILERIKRKLEGGK